MDRLYIKRIGQAGFGISLVTRIFITGDILLETTIYIKDSTKDMHETDSNSIDLIITSPPYWNRKDYKHPEQLGYGMRYDEYFKRLESNLLECKRVLKEDGLAVFIVGDVRPKASEISTDVNTRPQLYSIHSDIITFLCQNGLQLYDQFIWRKESTKKGKKRYVIYGAAQKGYIYPPYVYGDMSIEYILVFRKPGVKRMLPHLNCRVKERISRKTAQDWLSSVWNIEPAKNSLHPAIFPSELPMRLIKLYSLEGDTVLDPFCGIGTTLEEAIKLNRRAIGYEINFNYLSSFIKKYKMDCRDYQYHIHY